MMKYSLGALVAAGLFAGGLVTSANAADLGGNCCADLEERIAELEATTARKGNRKVSLTVSGWVGQQISFWDDGSESNVYIHDLGSTLGSHVKFTGAATIAPGYSAGYVLHIEAINSDGLTTNAANSVGPALYNALSGAYPGAGATGWGGTQVLQSYWFLKSDHYGKVSVGRQSQASDNTAILVDGSGSLVPANWVAFDFNSFGIRKSDGTFSGLAWGNAQSCFGNGGAWGDCNGLTQNVVRYDSPTFGGFSVSASWGADDMWDVAGRYAGEWGSFKVAGAIAYNEINDANYNNIDTALGIAVPHSDYLQLGVYGQHVPTGLFALFNYGHLETDATAGSLSTVGVDADTYYVKGGLRSKCNPLGATIFYGEYLKGQDGSLAVGLGAATSSDLDMWGTGIVQEVDAAAMSVWVKYRGMQYSDSTNISYENFNYVGVGGLINF